MHERQLRSDRDIIGRRRARTFVPAHLHTRTGLSLHRWVTAARSGVGVRDAKAGRVATWSVRRKRVRDVDYVERSVGEMNGEGYDGTHERGEGGSSWRERERPLENYKLYVVPNRPSKIIPAHPAAIMNM